MIYWPLCPISSLLSPPPYLSRHMPMIPIHCFSRGQPAYEIVHTIAYWFMLCVWGRQMVYWAGMLRQDGHWSGNRTHQGLGAKCVYVFQCLSNEQMSVMNFKPLIYSPYPGMCTSHILCEILYGIWISFHIAADNLCGGYMILQVDIWINFNIICNLCGGYLILQVGIWSDNQISILHVIYVAVILYICTYV